MMASWLFAETSGKIIVFSNGKSAGRGKPLEKIEKMEGNSMKMKNLKDITSPERFLPCQECGKRDTTLKRIKLNNSEDTFIICEVCKKKLIGLLLKN